MSARRLYNIFVPALALALSFGLAPVGAQEGRVFNSTPETVAIWEFNELGVVGEALPDGLVVPDLSGNGLQAVVQSNGAGSLVVGEGDDLFGENQAARRSGDAFAARLEVEDHRPFEMGVDQSFSFELYIRRDEEVSSRNWGLLAGTWHSRTLLDDSGDPTMDGAWYGYGFLRNGEAGNVDGGIGGWILDLSPINPDGSFTPSFNEITTSPVEVPAGNHYLVAVIDREAALATVWLDGEMKASVGVPADRAFIAPTDYEPARMSFLNGVDDASRDAFRPPPTGYAIDAARVLRKALTEEEIFENWLGISDGDAVPPVDDVATVAVVTASSQEVLVGECISLSAANSIPGRGRDITGYAWSIDGGPFEDGEVTLELSFDAASPPEGSDVAVRVTDSDGSTSTATVSIGVNDVSPVIDLVASIGEELTGGECVSLLPGEQLRLDASGSLAATGLSIPPTAIQCPIANGVPVDPPTVLFYSWDFDGDGELEAEDAAIDLEAPDVGQAIDIVLEVATDVGSTVSTTLRVETIEPPVVGPAPPGRVFLETPETLAIWEFNDELPILPDEPLPDGTRFRDLSGGGLDATVEGNDGGVLLQTGGDPAISSNRSVGKVFDGAARVIVNEDEGVFEMDPDQSFSFELYVRRDAQPSAANWGFLAGTARGRNLIDEELDPVADGAWYGFGFVRHNEAGGWKFLMSPINEDRSFTPSFNEIQTLPAFEIPPGSHYVVATVDRTTQEARTYLDGKFIGRAGLVAGTAFFTPTGHEPALMTFLTGIDDTSRGQYRPAPAGYAIDAARFQTRAMTEEEVRTSWVLLRSGNPTPGVPGDGAGRFVRGDADANGGVALTDGIAIFNFLFLGGATPVCEASADADGSGDIRLTDGIYVLNFLFRGASAPPLPYPDCGPGRANDLDCASYPPCE